VHTLVQAVPHALSTKQGSPAALVQALHVRGVQSDVLVQHVPPHPSLPPQAVPEQLGVHAHEPPWHVPAEPADVVHDVPLVTAAHALPHALSAWHAPQPTAVQPEPEQHVPPQPSDEPQPLPEQLGVHAHEPPWHMPAEPAEVVHDVPLVTAVHALPHALSAWQVPQPTSAQPDPAQHVPLHPSEAPQLLPEQLGEHAQEPPWHVPAEPPDVVQDVPFVAAPHALPQVLSTWHAPQATAVQPDPEQHVPLQPSAAPQLLPEQLGEQPHVPPWHVPAEPPDVVHAVPFAVAVHALPHALSTWHVPQPTAVHPDPEQHVPPQPSAAPQLLPEQLGVHAPPGPSPATSVHVKVAVLQTPVWPVAGSRHE
jgi:hypothetical protein